MNNGLVQRDVCLVMKESEVLQIVENSAVMQLSVHYKDTLNMIFRPIIGFLSGQFQQSWVK